jgi:ubiquinone/menaquinone biosynthesis C-methylase UbiE
MREFELRHPGDMLKDDIVFDIISQKESKKKSLGSKRRSKLLDLGCGMGQTSKLLSQIVDTTGIDSSSVGIKIARKNVNGTFIVGDACKVPFNDEYFDYVVMKDVLEHIKNDEQAIKEARRILKKGGSLVLFVPYSLEDSASLEGLVKRITGYSIDSKVGHVRRYNKDEISEKLKGFKIEKEFYIAHFLFCIISLIGTSLFYDKRLKKDKNMNTKSFFIMNKLLKLIKAMGWVEFKLLYKVKGAGIFVVAVKS